MIVDHIDGDPDIRSSRARVYNAGPDAAVGTAGQQDAVGHPHRSSKGSAPGAGMKNGAGDANAIRFEDKKGEEQLWLHAQKDQLTEVENDRNEWAGRDRHKTIDRDELNHIQRDRTETVDHNETITVHSQRDEEVDKNETITIHQNRTRTVDLNETVSIGKTRNKSVGNNEIDKIGKTWSINVGRFQDRDHRHGLHAERWAWAAWKTWALATTSTSVPSWRQSWVQPVRTDRPEQVGRRQKASARGRRDDRTGRRQQRVGQ